jgi:glycosyltransferase involved in cell wall biosynthesis
MKIAVYAIALNEIKHCDRFMDACADADVVVVADTGSTDGTVEALRKRGAIVHQITVRPWRFDMARNAALALVPADVNVCLFLDLDEVPAPGFFDCVRRDWDPKADRGWVTFNTGSPWDKDKLHTRWNWHWKYAVHEIPCFYGEDRPARNCRIRDTLITHEPDDSKPRSQYLGLLEQCTREEPHDPRMWTYLTREYYFYRKWSEVLRAGQKTINFGQQGWVVEQAAVCRWMGEAAHHLGQREEATKWYRKGADLLPHEGEPWYGVAWDAYQRQDWPTCLDAATRVLECPRSTHYCHEAAVWDWKAPDLLSLALYYLDNVDEARVFAQEALEHAPASEHERIQTNLAYMEEKTLQ